MSATLPSSPAADAPAAPLAGSLPPCGRGVSDLLGLVESEVAARADVTGQAVTVERVAGRTDRVRLAGEDGAYSPVEVESLGEAIAFLRGAALGRRRYWSGVTFKRSGAAWRVLEAVEAIRGEDFAVFPSERTAQVFADGMGHAAWLAPTSVD